MRWEEECTRIFITIFGVSEEEEEELEELEDKRKVGGEGREEPLKMYTVYVTPLGGILLLEYV